MNSRSMAIATVAIAIVVALFVGVAAAATVTQTMERKTCSNSMGVTAISCDITVVVKENGTNVSLEGISVIIGNTEKYTNKNGAVVFIVARGDFTVFIDGEKQGYDSIDVLSHCYECGNARRIESWLDPLPVLVPLPAEVPAFDALGEIFLVLSLCVVAGRTITVKRSKK